MASRDEIVSMAVNLFDSYDTDNSGFLDSKEFKKVLKEVIHEISKNYPIDESRLNKLFTIYDTNSDKKISRKEFVKVIEDFVQ